MADIFNEVDEELRRDQALAFWNRYGNYLIGAALLVVLAVAGNWGWQQYQTHKQEEAAAQFTAAIQQADPKAVEAELARIVTEGGAYAVLARLRIGNAALASGDKDKARTIFAEVSADPGVDEALRGIAAIKAALLELEIGTAEQASALVEQLAAEGNPYRLSALEIKGLAALKAGDKAKATETFQQIVKLSETTGSALGVGRRAQQMLDRLKE